MRFVRSLALAAGMFAAHAAAARVTLLNVSYDPTRDTSTSTPDTASGPRASGCSRSSSLLSEPR